MITALKGFLQEEGFDDVQDVYAATLPFLATRFETFMRKVCEVIPVDPIYHLYFVLGGHTAQDPERPFRLYLLWARKKLPILDGDDIPMVYSAPSLMGLEYKLNKLCQEDVPLERILCEVEKAMEERAKADDEIGPPFRFVLITKAASKDSSAGS